MYVNVAGHVSITRLACVVDRQQRAVTKTVFIVTGSVFTFGHRSYFACRSSWPSFLITVKPSFRFPLCLRCICQARRG